MSSTVFTIGHSTHSLERLIALLRLHEINAVCDVRSRPWSRLNPQFNRESLEPVLRESGIEYRFLGEELGARSGDPSCYEQGRVVYSRIAATASFQRGLKRVVRGVEEGRRIAILCAEKEPVECHRTVLVSRHLAAAGVDVMHIHADGRLEPHSEALARIAELNHVPEYDMFHTHEELMDEAYARQEKRIAWETDEAPAAAL